MAKNGICLLQKWNISLAKMEYDSCKNWIYLLQKWNVSCKYGISLLQKWNMSLTKIEYVSCKNGIYLDNTLPSIGRSCYRKNLIQPIYDDIRRRGSNENEITAWGGKTQLEFDFERSAAMISALNFGDTITYEFVSDKQILSPLAKYNQQVTATRLKSTTT